MDVGQVLHDYVSLISGAIGVIGSAVWRHVKKKYFGSLNFFFDNHKIVLICFDKSGKNKMATKVLEGCNYGVLSFDFSIFNDKEFPIGLRNLSIEIDGNKRAADFVCNDKIGAVINIPSNGFVKCGVDRMKIEKEELRNIVTGKMKICFVAINQMGKTIHEKIPMDRLKDEIVL